MCNMKLKRKCYIRYRSAGEILVRIEHNNMLINYFTRCGWKVLIDECNWDVDYDDNDVSLSDFLGNHTSTMIGNACVIMQISQLKEFKEDWKFFESQIGYDSFYRKAINEFEYEEMRLLKELRKELLD